MSSMFDGLNLDAPSFFSEESVDEWMRSNHDHVVKVGKSIAVMYIPSMAIGVVFAISVAWIFSGGSSIAFGLIIAFIITFLFIVLVLLTFSSFIYFFKKWFESKLGIWFAEFSCNCNIHPIKALTKEELQKYRGNVGEMVDTCDACNHRIKLVRMWKKRI